MSAQPDQRPDPRKPQRRFRRYHQLLAPAPQERNRSSEEPIELHRPVTLPRALASIALMFGPALSAHLLLSQLLPPSGPATAAGLGQLGRDQQRLAAWLSAADLGRSSWRLKADLEAISGDLDRVEASQCALPVHQELQELQRRLSQDLNGGARPGQPSWKQRYGQQISSARLNLERCQTV